MLLGAPGIATRNKKLPGLLAILLGARTLLGAWLKTGQKGKSRTKVPTGGGLEPNSAGLQPKSDGNMVVRQERKRQSLIRHSSGDLFILKDFVNRMAVKEKRRILRSGRSFGVKSVTFVISLHCQG